jgi:hypothetical protein
MADPDTEDRKPRDPEPREPGPLPHVRRAAASVENVMKAMRKVGRSPRRIEAELRRR